MDSLTPTSSSLSAMTVSQQGHPSCKGIDLQGIPLAGVFQVINSYAGRRTLEGQSQAKIVDDLHPIVENILHELDRSFSVSRPPAAR